MRPRERRIRSMLIAAALAAAAVALVAWSSSGSSNPPPSDPPPLGSPGVVGDSSPPDPRTVPVDPQALEEGPLEVEVIDVDD